MKRLCLLIGMLVLALPAYAQIPSVWIDDLTWPEIQAAIAGGKQTAIIYTGSSEQNGPHMVIGKHNFIAHALAQRIAEELGDALVYPTRLPYGGSRETRPRAPATCVSPGTVTAAIGGILTALCAQLAQSALTAGFKVVAVHGRAWRRPGRARVGCEITCSGCACGGRACPVHRRSLRQEPIADERHSCETRVAY